MIPLWLGRMPNAEASPIPVPFPIDFVVKNGSITRFCVRIVRFIETLQKDGVSGNTAVCKRRYNFTHEVNIRYDAVQFDVFVFTVNAAAANTHCINGGNTQ